jgi:hypothetical protein
MTEHNLQVVLASRPVGRPSPDNFELVRTAVPKPAEGQVLLKIRYLSLDPYMRGRMSAAKSYAAPVELGQVMEGGTVAEVIESRHPGFHAGDMVLSHSGWQSYALADGTALRKLNPQEAPVTAALGVLGMPGFTAYAGLLTIGQPKPGETVVVAAASGPRRSARSRVSKGRGPSASRADPTNALSSETSSASIPPSITKPPISPTGFEPPARTGSTFISRMSAERSGRRSSRCLTLMPAFPFAGSSRSTTAPAPSRDRTGCRS